MNADALKIYTYKKKNLAKINQPPEIIEIKVAQKVVFKVTNEVDGIVKEFGQSLSGTPVGYIPPPMNNPNGGDNRSHLMARRFGGRDDLRNNVPLKAGVNQGRMGTVEDNIYALAKQLGAGQSIEVRVTVQFDEKAIAAEIKRAEAANDVPDLKGFRPLSVTIASDSEILVPPGTAPNDKPKFKDPISGTLKTAIIQNK
jgi:DNA/RNA non-specific endonuclease